MTEKLSLSQLQQLIRDSLYLSLPQYLWITAEIAEMTVNTTGHCYLELIEKNNDEKNIRARIRGIIWNNRFSFINSFFSSITGEQLRTGIRILVKAKVEYHELYGLSLVINDIDPAFTLGEMAVKRLMIIKRLEEDGVFTMNKEIGFPLLPQRIAVISSKNAAGYSDFINHLTANKYGYSFHCSLIESPVQGTETEKGIINALDLIADHAGLFDLVVLIRGGGSQTDLSWFDNYNIAYHVTQFPLPVVTGIGHDKDMSVTDMVANISLKTPTAVADYLIDKMVSAENLITGMSSEIRELSHDIISSSRELLSGMIIDLAGKGRNHIFKSGVVSASQSARLVSSVRNYTAGRIKEIGYLGSNLLLLTSNLLNNKKIKLSGIENSLKVLDPDNVLKRGYTITSLHGKILRNGSELEEGDIIDTRFSEGTVSSSVLRGK